MSKSETLYIVDMLGSLDAGETIVYAADKKTGQLSFEPLENISINNRSISTQYFSARSLERRVRGYYSTKGTTANKGELDIVTPLASNETEQF